MSFFKKYSIDSKSVVIAIVLLLFLDLPARSVSKALGVENGWDCITGDVFTQLNQHPISANANMVLVSDGVSKCDIGLGNLSNGRRAVIALSLNEVCKFLQAEREKDLLVVLVCGRQSRKGFLSNEFWAYLRDLGYKNIYIVASEKVNKFKIVERRNYKVAKIFGTSNLASRTIRCERDINQFEIDKIPRTFHPTEIQSFLKNSRDKKLLSVEVGKPFQSRQILFENFTKALGYEKVVFKLSNGFFQTSPKPI